MSDSPVMVGHGRLLKERSWPVWKRCDFWGGGPRPFIRSSQGVDMLKKYFAVDEHGFSYQSEHLVLAYGGALLLYLKSIAKGVPRTVRVCVDHGPEVPFSDNEPA